jgi:hypothetical protein
VKSVSACVMRRHLRRSIQSTLAYQSSVLGGVSASENECLPSRLSSLPVQRTTTGREPNPRDTPGSRGLPRYGQRSLLVGPSVTPSPCSTGRYGVC